jgi:glycosyltransferase involved in cell wall biosynthesis
MNYKFSIITPSHKYQTYIEELYESIVAQTYENWEWILYLNGEFRKYELPNKIINDKRVKIFTVYDDNTNIGYVKNKAFNLGTGDVLIEVDHDDILTPDCLEELAIAFEQNPDCGFVYSNNAIYNMKEEVIPYNPSHGWTYTNYDWNGKNLIAMNTFEPSSHAISYIWYAPDHIRAWRSDVYKKVGGHNVDLAICDDHELMIRTYLETKFYHIPKVLYIYRITGDNSYLQRNEAIQIKTKELHNEYAQLLAERDADLNGLLKVDIGGGLFPRKEYMTIDLEGADITWDLNDGIPLDDNSVGVLNASHVIEHLRDPIKTMREIYRVLAHGGWAFIEVPSTEGNGAWCDPTHVSFWNEDSFPYYTNKNKAQFIRNKDIRFMSMRLETNWWEGTRIAVVNTHLVALKDGIRFPGVIEI